MNSKEALERIKNDTDCVYEDERIEEGKLFVNECFFREIETIEKDIEVLEILKKHKNIPLLRVEQYIDNSKKYGWTTKDHKLETYDIDYTEEEYNKLKEWLKE